MSTREKARWSWIAAVFAIAMLAGGYGNVARAGDWYVATNGINAAAGGDAANPWLTIKYAIADADVTHGDTIHVGQGTYTEDSIALNKGVTIEGAGRDLTIVQAHEQPFTAAGKQVFSKSGTSVATLRNMTIRHGNFTSGDCYGAAIRVEDSWLTVDNCLIVSNQASQTGYSRGGAINVGDGDLVLINSEVRDNRSVNGGSAGISTAARTIIVSNCLFVGNVAVDKAGVAYSDGRTSHVELYDSSFISNSCPAGGGAVGGTLNNLKAHRCTFAYNSASAGKGGGLSITTDNRSPIVLDIQHLTFYRNSANEGGGIYLFSNIAADLHHCTIHSNTATTSGGGIYGYYGIKGLRGTIVAGNTAPTGPDLHNMKDSFTDSHALIGDNSNSGLTAGSTNANGSYIGTAASPIDPNVDDLADNGGRTLTCALQADSLAVDHGYNPLSLETDQRGFGYARVVGAAADIGAFEFGAGPGGTSGTIILVK